MTLCRGNGSGITWRRGRPGNLERKKRTGHSIGTQYRWELFVDMVESGNSARYDLLLPAFRANMSIPKNRGARKK